MIYHVKAKYIEKNLHKLYKELTNGVIQNMKPDGEEMVASMKRAKIFDGHTVQWFEMCYCETPLQSERGKVFDQYFTDMETTEVSLFGDLDGESFFEFLKKGIQS